MSRSGIRREGGGRKSALESIAGLDAAFLRVLVQHTAGSPMDESVKWTNLRRHEIAELLKAEGINVSVTVVDKLLKRHHYRKRKAQKRLSSQEHPLRNEQFEKIEDLIESYQAAGNPVISMDTKKELIGSLYREGQLYTQAEIKVHDHDWVSLAEGVVIPHGLYDQSLNLNILTSLQRDFAIVSHTKQETHFLVSEELQVRQTGIPAIACDPVRLKTPTFNLLEHLYEIIVFCFMFPFVIKTKVNRVRVTTLSSTLVVPPLKFGFPLTSFDCQFDRGFECTRQIERENSLLEFCHFSCLVYPSRDRSYLPSRYQNQIN